MRKPISVAIIGGALTSIVAVAVVAQTTDGSTDLSPTEMSANVADYLSSMVEWVSDTEDLADAAREEEEGVQRWRCVNDNLTTMNGFVRVAEESSEDLAIAIDAGDRASQEHEYNLVSISYQRSQELFARARQCAGEILLYTGDERRTSSYDGELPTFDVTDWSDFFDDVVVVVTDNIPESSISQ